MSELVTDEMVEKAGRAIWEHDNGHTTWPPRDPLEVGPAEDAARAALEAASPLIAGRALREAAVEHVVITHSCFKTYCADCREQTVNRSWRERLTRRARKIEKGTP